MIEEIPNIKSNGFKVLAKSVYVPEMSSLEKSKYFFAYLIRIYNLMSLLLKDKLGIIIGNKNKVNYDRK